MELLVTIPDDLYERLSEQIDNGPYDNQREFVESAIALLIDVRERANVLVDKSASAELSQEEQAEYELYVRTAKRSELLKLEQ